MYEDETRVKEGRKKRGTSEEPAVQEEPRKWLNGDYGQQDPRRESQRSPVTSVTRLCNRRLVTGNGRVKKVTRVEGWADEGVYKGQRNSRRVTNTLSGVCNADLSMGKEN